MSIFKIYCDGGARSQVSDIYPVKFGSVSSIVHKDDIEIFQINKGFDNVTNNQMELSGFILPIFKLINTNELQNNDELLITSDSQYLLKGIEEWLPNWKKNGWKGSNKKIIKNLELWQLINKFLIRLEQLNIKINLEWVKGHNGHPMNEECDRLCTQIISELDSGTTPSNFNSLINGIIKVTP